MTKSSPRRRLREEISGQEGMTLVELMVSMMVLGVTVAAIFGVLFSVQRGVERQIDTADRNSRMRLGTEAIDREIRSAYAMTVEPGGQEISIYTANNLERRGGDRETDNLICAQFKIDGGTLYQRDWVDPVAPGASLDWNIVVTGISTTGGAFEVYDPDGDYDGSLLKVNLMVDADDSATSAETEQYLRGDNVSEDADNPCDEVSEQPT